MKRIAIVILNWNGQKMLEQYLPSVLKHSDALATIYVADNASTDNSIEFLRSQYPTLPLILLDKNYGFAEGYNRALAEVKEEYLLLLNSDIEVTEHWLEPMINFLDTHTDYAACQPKLLSIYERDRFEYAGAAGGFIDKWGYPYCRGRLFDTVEKDTGQYDSTIDIHWATGAALMVRREDFFRVGGLDARFFAHQEEIDFCWRLRLAGSRIACVTESKVYHVGGGTLPKSNPMKTFLNFRNNLTMLYKNLPETELNRVMRIRWWLDYLAAVQTLLLNRNVGDFKAILRGRKAFKKWRKDFANDRKQIQLSRVINGKEEKTPISLLFQYYAHHRHTFNTLKTADITKK